MSPRLRAITLVLFTVAGLTAQAADTTSGIFSRSAKDIWGTKRLVIPSPDGRKSINVDPPTNTNSDEPHTVILRANGKSYPTGIGSWVNSEAAWAPDSKAFFVTYSDGGNVGTYHIKIFYVTDSGLRVLEPIPNGRTLFQPRCFDPERPNVGAIKWIGADSGSLLIAVEVPPHSSCASMGTFEAFEIELPSGKVVSHYDQLTAKKLFKSDLGGELLNADDVCIRKPQSCVPSGLDKQRK
jgi:hypothetical protein